MTTDQPTDQLDSLIRQALDDPSAFGVLLDWCEGEGWDDRQVAMMVRGSQSEVGPSGGYRCPECGNASQNAVPHGSPTMRRCASCKQVWGTHLPWTVLRGWYDRQGWERDEFFGAVPDLPRDEARAAKFVVSGIHAVQQLIDRTEGTVECPRCRGLSPKFTAPLSYCHTCKKTGRVPNPDAARILELYALMLRDAGHREWDGDAADPGIVDVVPGFLRLAAKGWWPTRDEDENVCRWHSDLAYTPGPSWVVPEALLLSMPGFDPSEGSEACFRDNAAALHALALAAVTATVDCPLCPDGPGDAGCPTCDGSGRVPFLEVHSDG